MPIKHGCIVLGTNYKKAKYAIVNHDDNIDNLKKNLQKIWSMEKPKLIISIIGSDEKFSLPSRIKSGFKYGLVKIAETTNAIIITGGIYNGVMKLVGEAMANYNHKENVTLLGITNFSTINFKDELVCIFLMLLPIAKYFNFKLKGLKCGVWALQ